MSEPVLRVSLSAGYGSTTVLHDVRLDLREGDSVGLVGTSGAGKSTLVLALLGLLPWRRGWARGEVLLKGRNLLALSEREARRIRGKEIALVPQSPMSALNPAVSLHTHFRESWDAHQSSREGFLPRVGQLLSQMKLPDGEVFLRRRPGEISVGQAQRIVLALALLHQPVVLIADEPTSALDPETQVEVLELLRSIQGQQRTTLLYISHDILSVLQLCQQVAVIKAGTIATVHPVSQLCSAEVHPSLKALLQLLPVPIDVLLQELRMVTKDPILD